MESDSSDDGGGLDGGQATCLDWGGEVKEFLIALPCFPGSRGFNHRTILVKAIDLRDAISLVRHLRPHCNIGEVRCLESQSGGRLRRM